MFKKGSLALLLILLFSLTSCGKEEVRLTSDQYPICRGDVMASSLAVETMSALTGLSSDEARGYTLLAGSTDGYEELLSGKAQLVFTTQMPDDTTLEAAKNSGITLEVTPVARDALVFLTNEKNPVRSLTMTELTGIYAGTITDWRSLSGDNEAIIPYRRAESDPYHTLFTELVMKDTPFGEAPLSLVTNVSGDPLLFSLSNENSRTELAPYENTPGSIYYGSRYYFAGTEEQNGIRLVSVEGADPSLKNIKNGRYSLTYELFAVIRSDSRSGSAERVVVDWLLSRDGQEKLEEAGYVSIS